MFLFQNGYDIMDLELEYQKKTLQKEKANCKNRDKFVCVGYIYGRNYETKAN